MKIACFVEKYNFNQKPEILALDKFKNTAERLGHSFDFIFKKDINDIIKYDAVFIRALTDPTNIAYIVSRFAEQNGIPVIDTTHSIRTCSNKIVLYDIFKKNKIPTPKSMLFTGDYSKESLENIWREIKFPIVLKSPNTSFSAFVEKANNESEFKKISKQYLKKSSVILLQEYIKSEFDWRVGILDNKILYLCKYHIPKGGWKVRAKINGRQIWGDVEAISRKNISKELKKISIKTSKCIGDGLYGLDIKEVNGNYFVIEINDNPSIHAGHEDAKNSDIYMKIIKKLTP